MRTYGWMDPTDARRGRVVQVVHRSAREDRDVEKLARFIERNDTGSRNEPLALRDLVRDT